jgi:hypothetical protein
MEPYRSQRVAQQTGYCHEEHSLTSLRGILRVFSQPMGVIPHPEGSLHDCSRRKIAAISEASTGAVLVPRHSLTETESGFSLYSPLALQAAVSASGEVWAVTLCAPHSPLHSDRRARARADRNSPLSRRRLSRSGFITPEHWGLPWRDTSAVLSSERSPTDGSRTVRTHGCAVGKERSVVTCTQGLARRRPKTSPESASLRGYPLGPAERRPMARPAGAVSVPQSLLAAPPGLGSPRRVAQGVARVLGRTGRPRPTRLG